MRAATGFSSSMAGGRQRRSRERHGQGGMRFAGLRRPAAVTVREFIVPAPVRLAQAVAAAAVVRDAAAFAALVVLFTLFAVLSGTHPEV